MEKNLHRTNNPQISFEEYLEEQESILLDVRAPKEFTDGYIPEAKNLPLLDDTERETVGIIYKQLGQHKAVEKGYDLMEPKFETLRRRLDQFSKSKKIFVYCARGGMRSQVVTALLRLFGFNATQLKGGYKAFRNWNLQQLDNFKINNLIILHGQTGVGKTLVLNKLPNSVDLEGIAQHRGSMFGGIGKQPVTQKMFDALLIKELFQIDNSKPVFFEGESRKIGPVSIHNNIFSQMRQARNYLLTASLTKRVERTIDEYVLKQPDVIDEGRSIITHLQKDLGKKQMVKLLDLFDQGDYTGCFRQILENYYDKKYSHGIKQLDFEKEIEVNDIDRAVSQIIRFSRETP